MDKKVNKKMTPYIVLGLLILVLLPSSYLISKVVVNNEFRQREQQEADNKKKDSELYSIYQACLGSAMDKLDRATDKWCKANRPSNSEEKSEMVRGYEYCNESIRAKDLEDDKQVYETEMGECEKLYRN